MSPYLAKVAKRRARIVLVDAFAGAGRFSDGTAGSPLIICQAAEKYAKGKYDAYFFNSDPSHHEMLTSVLDAENLVAAKPILGDAIDQLRQLIASLRNETLFLYIDPYGLNCEFDVLRPLLERDRSSSTEILINLHMPISHRLGSRHTSQGDGPVAPRIQSYHHKLTRVYGGEYWKNDLVSDYHASAKKREKALVDHYREKLASTGYLTYTGACPIRETTCSATKYFMVFASRHPDSMLLLNDEMCKSYNKYMNDREAQDTLFSKLTWQDWRDDKELTELVLSYVAIEGGTSRIEVWLGIVQEHFMHFTSAEYRSVIKELHSRGKIECFTSVGNDNLISATRINDETIVRIARQQELL